MAGCARSLGAPGPGRAPRTVDVQLIAFNDFHGTLDPPTGSNSRIGTTEAGGVEYLATLVARLRAANPNTIVVSAGDNIGASPLLSGMFHDEPTIEALGQAGLQISAVGNHELDEGWWELYRMQKGGCHPVDGCQDKTPFAGARFQFLSANVILDARHADQKALRTSGWRGAAAGPQPLFPPYAIRTVGGVKVGFIGLVLRGAREVVAPTATVGLTFRPEAEAANEAAAALVGQGVRAIVVLIHEGGTQGPTGTADTCEEMTGPIGRIVDDLSSDIDVVVSGHTHQAYNCMRGTTLLTSAASFGRLVTDIDMRVDRATGEVVAKSAHNLIVTRDVPKSAAVTAILDHYRPLTIALGSRVVGSIATEIQRLPNMAGESALGGLLADAFLEATKNAAGGGAVAAFINGGVLVRPDGPWGPGGIRGDLTGLPPATPGGPRQVTYGQLFEVLPYGNRPIVKTLSGDAILRVLEQQFDNPQPGSRKMLEVSTGVSYTYRLSGTPGRRVDPASVMIGGRPLDRGARYRVTFPDFVWDGGDGFTVLSEGTDPADAGFDVDVLAAYLGQHSPVPPPQQNRIRREP